MTAAQPPVDVLDWSATATREASLGAMSAYAERLLADIEGGRPVHDLHDGIDLLLDRFELVMGTSHWGVGLEIGAGSGYASAALSRRSGVERVYVHDQSPELAAEVMPRMFDVSRADAGKLVRVVGDFERFELPDGELDFVLAIAALHHADDLGATVREIERVLRPGGFVLVLDRYQPDSMTRAELDSLLDIPVDPVLRDLYRMPATATRADLGEHEIRLAEWKYHFLQCAFRVHAFTGFTFRGRWWSRLVGAPWRFLLDRVGERHILRARRTEVLGAQLPLDLGWLLHVTPPSPTNLLLVATKYGSA